MYDASSLIRARSKPLTEWAIEGRRSRIRRLKRPVIGEYGRSTQMPVSMSPHAPLGAESRPACLCCNLPWSTGPGGRLPFAHVAFIVEALA